MQKGRPVLVALLAALLFGATTPLALRLLGPLSPWALSGWAYLGAGSYALAFLLVRRWRARQLESPLAARDLPYLASTILLGGLLGPVLLFMGLLRVGGMVASLLLNLEGVFTVLLGVALGEALGLRSWLGVLGLIGGGALLALGQQAEPGTALGALLVVSACLAWGLDNTLTRSLSGKDPEAIVAIKGFAAGTIGLLLGHALGVPIPVGRPALAAMGLGAIGYGLSLTLYVRAQRHLGSARTGAFFAIGPFLGALLAIPLLGEQPTAVMGLAALAMATGLFLLYRESHFHLHRHEPLEHSHAHVHDVHHRHSHLVAQGPEPHAHRHRHETLEHSHPHWPDLHHRHPHGSS